MPKLERGIASAIVHTKNLLVAVEEEMANNKRQRASILTTGANSQSTQSHSSQKTGQFMLKPPKMLEQKLAWSFF